MAQQVWLITGCSSGIGEALAKAVLARGDLLIATARAPVDRLGALKQAGATTLELEAAASPETIAAVVQKAVDVHGRIDVLVPCAGYLEAGITEGITPEIWEKQLSVNLFGVVNLVTALLPHMRKRKAGTIAFTNSVFSHVSNIGNGPYAVSKHATAAYAKTLSTELGTLGIKIISFDIGFVQTPVLGAIKFHPTGIEDYVPTQESQMAIGASMAGNMPGDVGNCAEAIIKATKSAKRAFTLVPLGADALLTIRKYAELLNDSCDEWDEVGKSVEGEGPRRGFWTEFEHYCVFESPAKQSQEQSE